MARERTQHTAACTRSLEQAAHPRDWLLVSVLEEAQRCREQIIAFTRTACVNVSAHVISRSLRASVWALRETGRWWCMCMCVCVCVCEKSCVHGVSLPIGPRCQSPISSGWGAAAWVGR